jgi:phosphate transport system permease protein
MASAKGLARTTAAINGDSVLKSSVGAAAVAIIVLLGLLVYELSIHSELSFSKFGIGFLWGTTFDVTTEVFGAAPFIYGTFLTSFIALLIAVPISLAVAIFLTEKIASRRTISYSIGTLVELLAAVPSVIYGLWGLLVFSPILKTYVEEPLHIHLGFLPIFATPPFGLDYFTAGVVLAVMIIPTIAAITRDVFNAVPNSQREAMYALGATNWETISKSVIPYSRSGILGAVILGLGRAVGETMAVTMLIGNAVYIGPSLFHPGYSLTSIIANDYFETTTPLFQSSMVEIALVLFLVALLINVFARLLIWRLRRNVKTGGV